MTRPPVRAAVEALMPRLKDDLARLVAIPSVSAPGYPESTRGPLLGACDAVAELFREAGVGDVRPLELPDTAPLVTGEIPAPDGAPTVLLYSHYDVVPAGDESLWASPPFEATERDGAIFGRGTADARGPDRRSGAFRSGAQRPASSPPNQRCQIPPANPSLLRGEPTAIVAVFTARSRGWGLKAD